MKRRKAGWTGIVLAAVLLCAGCQANPSQETSQKKETAIQASLNEKAAKAAADKKLEKLYEQKIEELLENETIPHHPEMVYYDLFDLDGDGQWEMILSIGEAHAADCLFYTCQDGKVTAIDGRCGGFGHVDYYPESQIIADTDKSMGVIVQSFYRIQDKKLERLYTRTDGVVMDKTVVHIFNDQPVTTEELSALTEEYNEKYPIKGEYVTLGRGRCYVSGQAAQNRSSGSV